MFLRFLIFEDSIVKHLLSWLFYNELLANVNVIWETGGVTLNPFFSPYLMVNFSFKIASTKRPNKRRRKK